jgi:tRNA G18 (ribose-2'-O)-methylase SpoU
MEVLKKLKNEGFEILAVELTPTAIDYKTLFNYKKEKLCLIV